MAKLIDVAEKSGVSVATASLALSGKGRISEEVRKKVIDIANDLDYRKTKPASTRNWVLLLNIDRKNDHLSFFFNPIIRQLHSSASENGFNLLILPYQKEDTEEDLFREILELQVSAVYSIHFASVKLFGKLELINIPCVVINNSSHQDELYTVCVDDFHGAYEGTLQLLRSGHRHIGCIDYFRPDMPGIVSDRYFGYRKALEEWQLPFSENQRITVDLQDTRAVEDKVTELILNFKPSLTALFIHDDMLASRVILILEKLRMKVPEDISIIAPGDTLNYDLPGIPMISTMKIDNSLMGHYAIDMMIERINKGEKAPHVLKIKQIFMDRKSIRKLS